MWITRLTQTVALAIVCASSFSQTSSQVIATTPQVIDIVWPDVPAGAPIPDRRLRTINDTLLPVLIPNAFLNYRSFRFINDELNYTAQVRARGAMISITGTRIASVLPDGVKEPQGDAAAVSQAAGAEPIREPLVVRVSKVRFGAAYEVVIECERPGNRWCADDAYARSLLDSAEFFGGTNRQPTSAPRRPPESDQGAARAPLPDFAWKLPGELIEGSGTGVKSQVIYAPGIRFPESPPLH